MGKEENAVYQHFLLFPQCFLPYPRQVQLYKLHSTLSKMTHFRFFQTERVWGHFKFYENGLKFSKWVEYTAKKEKLLITSNFSFSRNVFKRLVLQTRINQGLFGKGLNCPLQIAFDFKSTYLLFLVYLHKLLFPSLF